MKRHLALDMLSMSPEPAIAEHLPNLFVGALAAWSGTVMHLSPSAPIIGGEYAPDLVVMSQAFPDF